MQLYINPNKIVIRHIKIAFSHTFYMRIIKKPSILGLLNNLIFSVQKYMQLNVCV